MTRWIKPDMSHRPDCRALGRNAAISSPGSLRRCRHPLRRSRSVQRKFCAAGFVSNDIFAERPDLGPPVNGDPIRLEAAASMRASCMRKSRASRDRTPAAHRSPHRASGRRGGRLLPAEAKPAGGWSRSRPVGEVGCGVADLSRNCLPGNCRTDGDRGMQANTDGAAFATKRPRRRCVGQRSRRSVSGGWVARHRT